MGADASARPRPRDERGASAVEFALIVPIFMVLVFAIIDFGDMMSVRQAVSQAAAEGARAAAVTQGDSAAKNAAAQAAITSALAAHGGTCNSGCKVDVTDDCGDSDSTTTCAKVTVDVDYHALIPGYGFVLPDTLSYTASARVS